MNIDALADSVFVSVKGYIANSQKAMEATLREFVKSMVDAIPRAKDGIDGKDADEQAIAARVLGDVTKALDTIPLPKDGRDGAAGISGKDGAKGERGDKGESGKDGAPGAQGDPGPAGKDGAPGLPGANGEPGRAGENGKDGAPGPAGLKGDPGANGKDGRDGIDGRDFDPTVLRAECQIAARAAVAELPPAPAGKSITLDEVRPLIDAEIDRRMALVRTPEDGKSVTVDEIKPLLEGEVSRWELEFERRAEDRFQRALERMPKPKDGLGFDDLTIEEKDDRTLAFVFRQGDREKRFEYTIPVMIDRGTFKAGQSYEKGDGVTYGGSLFFAQRATLPTEKPEDGSGAFRLAVKRGRDGS